MKRIIYILLILVAFSGCDDYNYNAPDPDLTVKESYLEFGPKGGEGYILVESTSAISAKSDVDWCTVNVVDNKIIVAVASFLDNVNRTALVTITSNKGIPVNVPVTQTCALFIIDDMNFEVPFLESEVKTAVRFEGEINMSTLDEWIIPEYRNDTIYIKVLANEQTSTRTGKVSVKSGEIIQTIVINQAKRGILYEELLGTWTFKYKNFNAAETTKTVIFEEKEKGANYLVKGFGNCTFPIYFDSSSQHLSFKGDTPVENPGNLKYFVYGWNGKTGLVSGPAFQYIGVGNIVDSVIEYSFSSNNETYKGAGIFEVTANGYSLTFIDFYMIDLVITKQ